MRVKVPFIGTVIGYKPGKRPEFDEVSGDPNDPVRIGVNLGNVGWTLISLDIESGLAEIEVAPAKEVCEDTGQVDGDGKPVFVIRPTTGLEKQALLDNAKVIADADIAKGIKRLIRKDTQDDAISL